MERSRTQERARQQAQERRQQLEQRRAQPAPSAKQTPRQVEKEQRAPGVAGQRAPDTAGKRGPQAQPVARVQASDQQRRQVRERLFRDRQVQRIPSRRIGVPLTIGSRIPHRHRLHRFTPALLALAPMYAAYSYLVVDDTICVVDPESYAIVDVIPAAVEQAGPPSGSSGARLALSADEMRCIYERTPKEEARVDLRLRLALGAEIPREVKLAQFPERVLRCAPGLANLGYIVVQDDLVIVDPADYAIVQVITA